MAKFIGKSNDYRIYELTEQECKQHKRIYPTIVCWKDNEEVGNMDLTENETKTAEEMYKWTNLQNKNKGAG